MSSCYADANAWRDFYLLNFNINFLCLSASLEDLLHALASSRQPNSRQLPSALATNLGRRVLELINNHFPRDSSLHKLFNRNCVKLSYSLFMYYKYQVNYNHEIINYRNGNSESSVICQYVCQSVLFVQPIRSFNLISKLVLCPFMKITRCLLVLFSQ